MSKKFDIKVWDIFQLILRPKKCSECDEYMPVYKTIDTRNPDDPIEKLERKCLECEGGNKHEK